MAEKKNQGIKYTTPKGIALYPRLTEPDTKFDANGVFTVKIKLTSDEAQELMGIMDKVATEAYQEAKAGLEEKPSDPKKIAAQKRALAALTQAGAGYTMDCDDEGEETGDVIFSFKMKHIITKADKSTMKIYPKLFDAAGKAIAGKPSVFGGSTIRVSCTVNPYYTAGTGKAGASLRLNAVQIIKLVSGGGTAEGFGFDEEEGGYEDDTSATPSSSSEGSQGSSEAPEDF